MRATVDLDVAMALSDGTVLRANVFRPGEGGPWPVLLARSPYGKDTAWLAAVLDPLVAARAGFMVVVQDTRGRFRSEGDWEPMAHEAADGAEAVAWAAGLPGANGRVGMFGPSYLGFAQWAAASRHPPALGALAPLMTWSDPADGLWGRGGAVELGIVAAWNLAAAIPDTVRRHAGGAVDPAAAGDALRAVVAEVDGLAADGYWATPVRHLAPLARHGLADRIDLILDADEHPEALDHLRLGDVAAAVDVPAFGVGGWYDIFLQGTLDNFVAQRRRGVDAQLVVGPWTHHNSTSVVGEVSFGLAAQAAFVDLERPLSALLLDWFGQLRPGAPHPEGPRVRIFTMGANRWRSEDDWPLARAVDTSFFLRAGGRLDRDPPAAEEPDAYVSDPHDPVPTVGGATNMAGALPAGPFDQRAVEARPDVLTYTTDPLPADLEVTGRVRVRLFTASSAPSADLVARLSDVGPDGRSIGLADGIVRVSAPPGELAEHVVDLWSTSNLFRAGHRLRLVVTASSFPRWDRNPHPGRQLVFHQAEHPSALVVPVIPS